MLIKRIKELIFSNTDNPIIVSQANFLIDELIKILLMGDRCKQDIPHWLDNAVGAINKASNRLDSKLSKSALFLGLEENIVDQKVSQIKRSYLRNMTPEDYIKWRYKEVYGQTSMGNLKYQHLLKKNTIG